MTFKIGDRVVQTQPTFNKEMVVGRTYTVRGYRGTDILVDGMAPSWDPRYFELAPAEDPSADSPHAPGAKLDKGKVRPALILEGMARALNAVSEVATFGANKYTDGGWVSVPNGQQRYADAQLRHMLARASGQNHDPESKLLHLAHEAWNALAKLDLYLREQEKAQDD